MNARYLEVCEKLDWTVREDEDGTVELEKYSPAGEDFIVTVEADGFADNVRAYANSFDVDEHLAMWIMARSSGVGGVPCARELVKDAEDIDEMLKELAAALSAIKEDHDEIDE